MSIAWNAQLRILIARGKNHNVVITAIAREWAIARAVPIAG
jgi:hypothetical protein